MTAFVFLMSDKVSLEPAPPWSPVRVDHSGSGGTRTYDHVISIVENHMVKNRFRRESNPRQNITIMSDATTLVAHLPSEH